MVQKDHASVSLTSLPDALTLARGRLEVRFLSIEDLAQTMYFLARLLDADSESFAREFEPVMERVAEGIEPKLGTLFPGIERPGGPSH